MTYFNPKYYCKQNLKEDDKRELDFWCGEILSLIENAESDHEYGSLSIEKEIIHKFCEGLKERLGYSMQEVVVGTIDGYDDEQELKEWDEPDTYLYAGEDED